MASPAGTLFTVMPLAVVKTVIAFASGWLIETSPSHLMVMVPEKGLSYTFAVKFSVVKFMNATPSGMVIRAPCGYVISFIVIPSSPSGFL